MNLPETIAVIAWTWTVTVMEKAEIVRRIWLSAVWRNTHWLQNTEFENKTLKETLPNYKSKQTRMEMLISGKVCSEKMSIIR